MKIDPSHQGKGFVSNIKRWFNAFGPGLITAALVFGPGSLTITSKLGALYGHKLFWIIAMSIFS